MLLTKVMENLKRARPKERKAMATSPNQPNSRRHQKTGRTKTNPLQRRMKIGTTKVMKITQMDSLHLLQRSQMY